MTLKKNTRVRTTRLKSLHKPIVNQRLYSILRTSPVSDAIAGTHYASRVLQYNDERAGNIPGISESGKEVGMRLIHRLELITGKRVASFNRKQSDRYIKSLSSLVKRKTMEQSSSTVGRGSELLSFMKSQSRLSNAQVESSNLYNIRTK